MKNNILLLASFTAVLAAYSTLGAAAAAGTTVVAGMLLILLADYADHPRRVAARSEVLRFPTAPGLSEDFSEAA
jgi:hypothetical protein